MVDNANPADAGQAGAPAEHYGLNEQVGAALDKLSKRLDHGGDIPDVPEEVTNGAALTEREAAAKLGERRRAAEDEADRARQRAKDAGIQVKPATDDVKISLYNARDPTLPPALPDGTPLDPKRGVGINLEQATAALKQAHSQLDEERRQQDSDLNALLGDEANSAPATDDAAQPEQPAVEPDPQQRAEAQRIEQQLTEEQQRRQYADEWQRTAVYANQLEAAIRAEDEQSTRDFAELANPATRQAKLQEMQILHPDRYASLQHRLAQFNNARAQLQQIRQGQQQHLAAAQQGQIRSVAEYAAREKAEAEKLILASHPELRDPVKEVEFRRGIGDYLKAHGTEPAQFAQAVNRGKYNRMELSALADAVMWRNAQSKAKEVVAKPLPPVQRPGVSQGRNGQYASVQPLIAKASSARGINPREAVRLMQARRGAR